MCEGFYILESHDESIVQAAKGLLWKITRSAIPTAQQVEQVTRVLAMLDRLPAVSDEMSVSIELSGPRRWFGEHEIWHWWEILVEDQEIQIRSGGHFYRKSSGGDAFSCMQWWASPGQVAEFNDFLDSLGIVDDAMPFEAEVQRIDLSEEGYSLTVYADGDALEDSNAELDEDDTESE